MSTVSARAASGSVEGADLVESGSVLLSRVQHRAIAALALIEARRVLLHPAYLTVFVFVVIGGQVEFFLEAQSGRKATFDALVSLFAFYLPLLAIFPASLVASSARRAGATETLDALPISSAQRTTAALLASFGPAAIAGVAAFAIWQLSRGLPSYELDRPASLLAVPLLYLGLGGLAVAATRWLPWPGVPIAVVALLFVWVGTASSSHDAVAYLTVPWLVVTDAENVLLVARYSDLWHTVYLLGLVALAWTAAILRDRIRLMFLVGVPIGVLTLLAGWAQLP